MPQITDSAEILAILETDRRWAVYALGDMAPQHFPYCTWYRSGEKEDALAMLYSAFAVPVFFALGSPQSVQSILAELPHQKNMYLHVRPEILPVVEAQYEVKHQKTMRRMILELPAQQLVSYEKAVRLSPSDLPALQSLYADGEIDGETPDFFLPSMLTEGVFCGVWEGETLIAVAGTHLVHEQISIAAMGNVYTRRDRRSQGLAAKLTSAVAAELIKKKIRTIALNVNQQNGPAIHVYEKLGFVHYCDFNEGLAM